jgi:(2R)-3-sulfolactate dehydrogenase (NADP+)
LFSNNEGGVPNVGQSIIAFNPDFYSAAYLENLETMFTEMTHDNEVRIPGARRHEPPLKYDPEGKEVPQDSLDRIAAI